jgi:hypothetical protein
MLINVYVCIVTSRLSALFDWPAKEHSVLFVPKDLCTMHDIIDTAVAAGSFKTLATAVTAAGLVSTLKGAGPTRGDTLQCQAVRGSAVRKTSV